MVVPVLERPCFYYTNGGHGWWKGLCEGLIDRGI